MSQTTHDQRIGRQLPLGERQNLLTLPFLDIVSGSRGPRANYAYTYDIVKLRLGGNRVLNFRLREGTHAEDLAATLQASETPCP